MHEKNAWHFKLSEAYCSRSYALSQLSHLCEDGEFAESEFAAPLTQVKGRLIVSGQHGLDSRVRGAAPLVPASGTGVFEAEMVN